jgi:pimeloyl-ACP methyl ester carboxylesterase
MPEPERTAVYYAPGRTPAFTAGANIDVFLEKAIADEAIARFCWQPFMHDPSLPARLRRVRAPTLILSGASDRFVLNPGYYEGYAKLISGARHETVAGAGHRVEEEEADQAAARVASFISAPSRRADRRSLAQA